MVADPSTVDETPSHLSDTDPQDVVDSGDPPAEVTAPPRAAPWTGAGPDRKAKRDDELPERTESLGRTPLRRGHRGIELEVGQVLDGRYRLVQPIGAGGMGEVWEVAREGLATPLAVKVLKDTGADEVKVERFLREAKAVAMLDHTNIVTITDFGHTDQGLPFFVMEQLRGRTLDEVVRDDGPMEWARARHLLLQIADALVCAHDEGIIHRDLKPSNVFVTEVQGKEVCKIIDFGIAKFSAVHEDFRTLTQTGIVQGTPAYMSPEQARGERVDHRTDQYSLGILAYQVISGHAPFRSKNVRDTMYKQVFTHPDPLRSHGLDIPESVEAVVFRLLRKKPELRFADMGETRAALIAMGEGSEPTDVPAENLPSMSTQGTVSPPPTLEEASVAVTTPAPPRTRLVWLPLALGVGIGVAGVGIAVFNRGAADAPATAPGTDRPSKPLPSSAEPEPHKAAVAPAAPPSPSNREPTPPPTEKPAEGKEAGSDSHNQPPPSPKSRKKPRARERETKKTKGSRETRPATPPQTEDPKRKPEIDPALVDPFGR